MGDIYVNWDDLDLDEVLGENNWTDDEVLASDWTSSSDSESDSAVVSEILPVQVATAPLGKENKKPSTTTRKSIYQCPFCEKNYSSTSGFRGHVTKKHDRPDVKAYMNRTTSDVEEGAGSFPKKTLPLSTVDELKANISAITEDTLNGLIHDKFHTRPSSMYGATIINISQHLLAATLTAFHLLLIASISPLFSSTFDFTSDRFLQHISNLRQSPEFVERMLDIILTNVVNLELSSANMFLHRFLTHFTTTYLCYQWRLLEMGQQIDNDEISKNDKQVICYICGYILHALKKRYLKAKVKNVKLLTLIEHLYANTKDVINDNNSEWIDQLDRGGLKRPSEKFLRIIVQIERWVRQVVNINNLNANSLVGLKERLCDYGLLRSSWDRTIIDTETQKWLLLDHVVGLFVKVRGFAVTRLVRKQLQKKRKASKILAGSRKALRKELRDLSQ